MPKLPGPEYHVSTTLRVPIAFAYRWCTDFRPDDAAREGESYERRILERGPRRVVYEDLEWTGAGWRWARHVVTLKPPTRWRTDSVGNYRVLAVDYSLSALGPDKTRFSMVWRRKASPLAGKPPARNTVERSTLAAWRLFAKSMERDYRKRRSR
jgi:hypothetical protein